MEEWKWIDGYEGEYQVSTKGNIKSFKKYKEGIILKPKKDGKDKYLMICLSNNGSQKYYLIHRLVAQAFIQNPNNKEEVNHIDGNKKNNNVENLEWVTHSENIRHAFENNLTDTEIGVYIVDVFTGKIIKHTKSITLASDFTGISLETIRDIMNDKNGTGKQFIFIRDDVKDLQYEIDKKLKRTYVVQMIDKNTNKVIREFTTPLDAKEKLNVKSQCIYNCLLGQSNTACGYKWKYKYRDNYKK